MKAWTDLQLIAKPPRIAALLVDKRGYPIPAFAAIVNDVPDFRTVDPIAWGRCVLEKRCGICGSKMEGLFAFVGGPLSTKNRMYTDAPMHQECAEYALKVCPMLAAPKFAYAPGPAVPGMSLDRPEYSGLSLTENYGLVWQGFGVILHINPPVSVTWWKEGKQLPEEPS